MINQKDRKRAINEFHHFFQTLPFTELAVVPSDQVKRTVDDHHLIIDEPHPRVLKKLSFALPAIEFIVSENGKNIDIGNNIGQRDDGMKHIFRIQDFRRKDTGKNKYFYDG